MVAAVVAGRTIHCCARISATHAMALQSGDSRAEAAHDDGRILAQLVTGEPIRPIFEQRVLLPCSDQRRKGGARRELEWSENGRWQLRLGRPRAGRFSDFHEGCGQYRDLRAGLDNAVSFYQVFFVSGGALPRHHQQLERTRNHFRPRPRSLSGRSRNRAKLRVGKINLMRLQIQSHGARASLCLRVLDDAV